MKPYKNLYHAICGEGLTTLLEDELRSNHCKVESSNRGGVFFSGKKEAVISFCLSTKFASKVSLQLLNENAKSYDDLYMLAKNIPWENFISGDISFRIDSSTKDNLSNSMFAKHRLKDAILDRLREKKVQLPEIEPRDSDITVLLRSHTDRVSIEISLSGESVGRRGYRIEAGNAPVREPIAEAMLTLSDWKEGNTLVDPMCGSGTVLIEAALRERLNGEINRYLFYDSKVFAKLFPTYIFSKEKADPPKTPHLFGYDIDVEAIRIAKENAYEAGVEDFISFEVLDALKLKNVFEQNGHIITNPPYGERLGKPIEDLREFYFQFGKVLKNEFQGWKFTVLCGDLSLLGKFGLKSSKELILRHANLKAKIVDYELKKKT